MPTMTAAAAPAALLPAGAPPADPLLDFVDRSIRRERRLEALLRRAARGPWTKEQREQLRFEAYEDREHARILRRHRIDVVRGLGVSVPSPGARVAKVGRTTTPGRALAEALRLSAEAMEEYAAVAPRVADRFLRKFVEVLARAQAESVARLREVAGGIGAASPGYSTESAPDAEQAIPPGPPLRFPRPARTAGAA